jgi:signal transduction histidine kinase
MRFVLPSRLFRTVSFQLTALYSLIFALSFLALLFTIYWTTTAALRGQMKTEIDAQMLALASEADVDGTSSVITDIRERTLPPVSNPMYYFLSNAAGLKLAGNLSAVSPNDGWTEQALSDLDVSAPTTPDDDDHQVWGRGQHLKDGSFLFVGQDVNRMLATQEAIINSFAWSAGVALLLGALAGLFVSRGFLRRIDDINKTSLAIIDGRLKERIPVRGTSDEIDRLSGNLNQLFDSNQSLLESLKQVSANIAHDLRTPLSRLRQGLEEARNAALTKRTFKTAIDSAITESDQLLATFSALLRIAQIESGSRKAGFKDINLKDIFTRVADAYQAVAEDQKKSLETDLTPTAHFHGDAELLLQMIANLTENAIRHTEAKTKIVLSVANTASGIVATIADNGPGIPEDQREKVFAHFYRLDESRTTSGNGLGLALVQAIAKLHNIQIKLQDNSPGLRVVLQFPLSG